MPPRLHATYKVATVLIARKVVVQMATGGSMRPHSHLYATDSAQTTTTVPMPHGVMERLENVRMTKSKNRRHASLGGLVGTISCLCIRATHSATPHTIAATGQPEMPQ